MTLYLIVTIILFAIAMFSVEAPTPGAVLFGRAILFGMMFYGTVLLVLHWTS